MSCKITHSVRGDYINTEVHGELDRSFGLKMNQDAQAMGREYHIKKFLVDVSDAVNVDGILDQYRFANVDLNASVDFDNYSRIAVLASPDDHSHDFIETVMRNVGINFKLFRDRRQALDFLGVDSEEDQQAS